MKTICTLSTIDDISKQHGPSRRAVALQQLSSLLVIASANFVTSMRLIDLLALTGHSVLCNVKIMRRGS